MMRDTTTLRLPEFEHDREKIAATIISRLEFVETEDDWGTGFRVGPLLVLTANHVYEDLSWIKVDGKPAEIIFRDKKIDLLLLRVHEKKETGMPKIKSYLRYLTTVFIGGHRNRYQRNVIEERQIIWISKNQRRMFISGSILDGYSGGPVFLENGELAGFMVRELGTLETGKVGVIHSGSEIQRFFRKFEKTCGSMIQESIERELKLV